MCWQNLGDRVEIKIAQHDIPVFKICRAVCLGSGDTIAVPYYYPRRGVLSYEVGKVYKLGRKLRVSRGVSHLVYKVEEGFHSYNIGDIELKRNGFISVKIVDRKTNGDCNYILRSNNNYTADDSAIALCVIPKGGSYLINGVGEMVSDVIQVKELLKKPFKWLCRLEFDESVEYVNKRLASFGNEVLLT